MDERNPPGVDLLTQVADVELDDVRLAAEVVVPHPVQDLRLGQHPPGVAHEEPEQLELGRGQVDEVAVAADLAGVLVHGQVADHQRSLALRAGQVGPAQQAAQPGQHLFQAERLGHVVVAARRDAGHPVFDRVPRGQEQHAHLRELGADPAHHLKAVEIGEHDIEHHRVGAELARGPHRLRAAAGGDDVPAFVAQHAGQQLGQAGLVVDDEHAHGRAVRPLDIRVTRSG